MSIVGHFYRIRTILSLWVIGFWSFLVSMCIIPGWCAVFNNWSQRSKFKVTEVKNMSILGHFYHVRAILSLWVIGFWSFLVSMFIMPRWCAVYNSWSGRLKVKVTNVKICLFLAISTVSVLWYCYAYTWLVLFSWFLKSMFIITTWYAVFDFHGFWLVILLVIHAAGDMAVSRTAFFLVLLWGFMVIC